MDCYVGLHSVVSDDVHAYGVSEEEGVGSGNEMQIELGSFLRTKIFVTEFFLCKNSKLGTLISSVGFYWYILVTREC